MELYNVLLVDDEADVLQAMKKKMCIRDRYKNEQSAAG